MLFLIGWLTLLRNNILRISLKRDFLNGAIPSFVHVASFHSLFLWLNAQFLSESVFYTRAKMPLPPPIRQLRPLRPLIPAQDTAARHENVEELSRKRPRSAQVEGKARSNSKQYTRERLTYGSLYTEENARCNFISLGIQVKARLYLSRLLNLLITTYCRLYIPMALIHTGKMPSRLNLLSVRYNPDATIDIQSSILSRTFPRYQFVERQRRRQG
ncbi:hypothetical protein CCUS01_13717 [Colletotrichum cuscutae]|uniref:Uncharacterized protein n=1 Tax=Colletotrichum cuscutae TaxID=1209917 RepID=A0AAI9YBA8_9PEZI|nr:hypothetical protein CCUS01_13717 [Colletotrichum cuscutae]